MAQTAQFVDTSAAVAQITSARAQTVTLFGQLSADLPSLLGTFASNTTLATVFSQAYNSSIGGLDFSQFPGISAITIPSFPATTVTAVTPVTSVTTTLPAIIPVGPLPPSGDGVRIFGDTPLLLRETDPSIPAGAAFSRVGSGLQYASPETSTTTLTIGSYHASDLNNLWDVLTAATKISGKGLIGAAIKSLPVGSDFLAKASDVREIGEAQNIVLGGTIATLQNAIRVVNGSMSISEFESRQDSFHTATENMFNALRDKQVASAAAPPGWGPIFKGIVNIGNKVGAYISNTNSFELNVTMETAMQGGLRGSYLVGGDQHNTIRLGGGTSIAVGGDGGNLFQSGTGNDMLIGGQGLDTALYLGSRANFSVSNSGGRITVRDNSNALGTDTLSRVERVEFNDRKLAFDLTGSAGNAAKLIGAAFGPDMLTPGLVRQALNVFDAGLTLKQMADVVVGLPVFVSLAGSQSNADFVNLVFKNLVGSPPSPAQRDLFVGLLNQGISQGDFLVAAANTSINAVHIDLVGLTSAGLAYA